MAMSNPSVFLNDYLSEMVPKYLEKYGSTEFNYFDTEEGMRFFPVSPTAIDELTEQLPSATEAPFAVYDRMFRFKKYKFPHIKCEQMLYYFYKTTTSSFESATASLIETSQAVYDLLSRGDESAQEVNSWIKHYLNDDGKYEKGGIAFSPVFFHQTSVFQLEEIRDIIDFGTARTYAGNKIIIDYEYHNNVDFSVQLPFEGRHTKKGTNDEEFEDFDVRFSDEFSTPEEQS